MSIEFEEFSRDIHEDFKDQISLDDVVALLEIEGGYDRDTKAVARHRLLLDSIKFTGEKSDGSEIKFSHTFDTGVSIWIADNLKGKSSLFKIIKLALTGSNKIKADVGRWVQRILLNFTIDEKQYAIYVNLEGARLKGQLFIGLIQSITSAESSGNIEIFNAKDGTKFENEIQRFFFEKLGYYSLKWTAKSPSKDSTDLTTAGASWKTYFKTIYLESADSSSLTFGDQGTKIFQMLLGLDLTYPINQLSVNRDLLRHQRAKAHSSTPERSDNDDEDNNPLILRLLAINSALETAMSRNQEQLEIATLYESYEKLISQLQSSNQSIVQKSNEARSFHTIINDRSLNIGRLQSNAAAIAVGIDKVTRRIGDLEEYIAVGRFFSNLDIKNCPACDHSVSQTRKTENSKDECFLCSESVSVDSDEIGETSIRLKIERLTADKVAMKKENDEIASEIAALESKQKTDRDELHQAVTVLNGLDKTDSLRAELLVLETRINAEKEKAANATPEVNELIAEQAVIKFQLGDETSPKNNSVEILDTQIQVLERAIKVLNERRAAVGSDPLNRLRQLMLEEIKQFGLSSISEIEIGENFAISYKQDGNFVSFDEIAEGEQLRAKLAFYLSLMQLEIENKVGRHSRLLIIDSPAKEEGDSNYLHGFSEVLKNIESRFGNSLQILIGTAERGFEGVLANEFACPEGEFLF